MNDKEIGEIRRRVRRDRSNMTAIYGCFVNDQKEIITEYRVIGQNGGNSLLEVHLVTGRTHQIRAHLAHIGHPLLGDGKYGINKKDREKGYKYQALYAYCLRVELGGKGEVLSYLDGKEFRLPESEIWFLKDFPNAKV